MSTETAAEAVTRFEVIDGRADAPEPGRALVAYGVQVELSWQDSGQTLKVFLSDRVGCPDHPEGVRG